MIGAQGRYPRTLIVGIAALFFVVALVTFVSQHMNAWERPKINPKPLVPIVAPGVGETDAPRPPPAVVDEDGLSLDDLDLPPPPETFVGNKEDQAAGRFYIENIRRPNTRIDQKTWTEYGAFGFDLPKGSPKWTQPLGEKLCIIDLDNRKFDGPGEIFGPDRMSWDDPLKVHGLSVGILNHWLYAKIHGYKYYYVTFDAPEDRRASWKKPPILAKILEHHDACVYLDSDAIIHNLELPFEWLMNYWGLHPSTNSLALAVDPDLEYNYDKFGKLYDNTGFIVAQNNKRTFEIMRAWEACPDDGGKHPDCIEYRNNEPGKPTDQGGFGNYIRYDYAKDIKELSCNEANGFPESGTGCNGVFIRHLWTGKDTWIKITVGRQIPGRMLEILHQMYLNERPSFTFTEEDLMSQ